MWLIRVMFLWVGDAIETQNNKGVSPPKLSSKLGPGQIRFCENQINNTSRQNLFTNNAKTKKLEYH